MFICICLHQKSIHASPTSIQNRVNVVTGQYYEKHNDFLGQPARIYTNKKWFFSLSHPLQKILDENNFAATSVRNITEEKRGNLQQCTISTAEGGEITYFYTPWTKENKNAELLLHKVELPEGSFCSYEYENDIYGYPRIISRLQPQGRFLINEYYQDTENCADARGKIKRQLIPAGIENTPIAINHFSYEKGITERRDALGNKTIYRYDTHKNLNQIESYIFNEDGNEEIYKIEKFYWKKIPTAQSPTKLISKTLEDKNGSIAVCCTFSYDDLGNCLGKTLWGNLSGTNAPSIVVDSEGYPIDQTIEHYSQKAEETTHLENDTRKREDIQYSHTPSGTLEYLEIWNTPDTLGQAVAYRTDQKGRLVSITNFEGGTVEFEYDSNDNLISSTEVSSQGKWKKIACIYDYRDQLIEKSVYQENGEHFKEHYKYDAAGNKICHIDRWGNATHYEYDAFKRETAIVYPKVLDHNDAHITPKIIKQYDILDRVILSIDANGNVTKTEYNIRGKPTKIIYPSGATESFEYHLDGSLKKSINKNQITTLYHRNDSGEIATIEVQTSEGTSFTASSQMDTNLSTNEHLSTSYEPFSQSFSDEKTPLERIHIDVQVNNRGQHVPTSISTDTLGNQKFLTYDALGRVESFTQRNPYGQLLSHVEMRYDAVGNKIKEVHHRIDIETGVDCGSPYIIERQFDSCNRLISLSEGADYRASRKTDYTYHPSGNIHCITKPDGVVLEYNYTPLGLLESLRASDGSLHYYYAYDSNLNLVEAVDCNAKTATRRTFSPSGMLTSETLGNGLNISFAYNSQGLRNRLTFLDGSFVCYEYDENKNLSAISRASPSGEIKYTHSYEHSSENTSRIASTTCGSETLRHRIDVIGKTTEIKTPYWSEKISKNLLSTTRTIKDGVGTVNIETSSDSAGNISKETGISHHTYSYDSLRNRITKDDAIHEIDGYNQLKGAEKELFFWDENGNCTAKISSNQKTTYRYDALNRLISVAVEDAYFCQYTYDPFHRRLSKSLSLWDSHNGSWNLESEEHYLYDNNNEIGSADNSRSLVQLRILGRGKGAEIGATIAIELDEKVYAPIHDSCGSICCLVDLESLAPAEYCRYTVFGEASFFDGNGTPLKRSGVGNPWLFSGKRFEEEHGHYYFGMRYYAPNIGRWLTADPMNFIDGPNRYCFVKNSPIDTIDFYGLWSASNLWESIEHRLSSMRDTLIEWRAAIAHFFSFEAATLKAKDSHVGFPQIGTYGDGELNELTRITLANGVLNTHEDFLLSIQLVSETHGNNNVHYIFRPTLGFFWDFVTSMSARFKNISGQGELIAMRWKNLIEEMGGVGSGGCIIHYAHSIGGADTFIAKQFLSPEEQKMIHVITLGSPKLIPDEGFASVVNYISVRDAIPMMDPINCMRGLFDNQTHIMPVGSFFGIPFIDHFFGDKTYRTVIEDLGSKFLQLYSYFPKPQIPIALEAV